MPGNTKGSIVDGLGFRGLGLLGLGNVVQCLLVQGLGYSLSGPCVRIVRKEISKVFLPQPIRTIV